MSGSPLWGGGATRTVEVAFPALPWGERLPREHARAARDPLAPSAAAGAPGRGGWRCVLGARWGIPGSQEGRRTQPPPQVSSHVTPRSPQGLGARPKGTEASSPWGGALAPGSWPPSPPEPPTVWLTQCRNLPSPPSPRQAGPCPSGHRLSLWGRCLVPLAAGQLAGQSLPGMPAGGRCPPATRLGAASPQTGPQTGRPAVASRP